MYATYTKQDDALAEIQEIWAMTEELSKQSVALYVSAGMQHLLPGREALFARTLHTLKITGVRHSTVPAGVLGPFSNGVVVQLISEYNDEVLGRLMIPYEQDLRFDCVSGKLLLDSELASVHVVLPTALATLVSRRITEEWEHEHTYHVILPLFNLDHDWGTWGW